ncbi:MAG: hypothetical protein PHD63_02105, partial [Candidatus Marinimicrobia bacterium]|nr:hypothetical protein [Candidatus Neomarinimicrobiota bacterium]
MSGSRKIFLCVCLLPVCHAALWHIDDLLELSQAAFLADKGSALQYAVDPSAFPDSFALCCTVSPAYSAFAVREGLLCLAFPRLSFTLNAQYHPLIGNYRVTGAFPLLRESQIQAGLQIHYALSQIPGYDTRHSVSCSGGLQIIPHSDWRIFLFNRHFMDLSTEDQPPFLEPLLHAGLSYSPGCVFQFNGGLRKRADYGWQIYGGLSCMPVSVLQLGLQYDYPQSSLRVV